MAYRLLAITAFVMSLVSISRGQPFNGYNTFTFENFNCFYNLTVTTSPTKEPSEVITFNLTKTPASCSTKTLYFNPFFDQGYYYFPLSETSSGSSVITTFNVSSIASLNGTGCMYLQQTSVSSQDFYLCKLEINSTKFFLQLYTINNATIAMYSSSMMAPQYTANTTQGYVLPSSFNFSHQTYNVYENCDGSSRSIINLANAVYFKADKIDKLVGMNVIFVLLRVNSTFQKKPTIQVNSTITVASKGSSCYNFGVTWSQVVLGDSTLCQDGCQLSFMITDAKANILNLHTYGFSTNVTTTTNNATNTTSGTNNNTTGANTTTTPGSNAGTNTSPGGSSTTGGSQTVTTGRDSNQGSTTNYFKAISTPNPVEMPMTTTIIVSVVCPVVFLIIVAICVYQIRKRHLAKMAQMLVPQIEQNQIIVTQEQEIVAVAVIIPTTGNHSPESANRML